MFTLGETGLFQLLVVNFLLRDRAGSNFFDSWFFLCLVVKIKTYKEKYKRNDGDNDLELDIPFDEVHLADLEKY